jgi:hypothetical protein
MSMDEDWHKRAQTRTETGRVQAGTNESNICATVRAQHKRGANPARTGIANEHRRRRAMAVAHSACAATSLRASSQAAALARVDTRSIGAGPTGPRAPTRAKPGYAHSQAIPGLKIAITCNTGGATATTRRRRRGLRALPLPFPFSASVRSMELELLPRHIAPAPTPQSASAYPIPHLIRLYHSALTECGGMGRDVPGALAAAAGEGEGGGRLRRQRPFRHALENILCPSH